MYAHVSNNVCTDTTRIRPMKETQDDTSDQSYRHNYVSNYDIPTQLFIQLANVLMPFVLILNYFKNQF